MDAWVTWAIQGITGLAIGALCFFLKRTLTQFEQTAKEQKERIDKLDDKMNTFINNMPFQYTLRDDFIRTVAGFDAKLDKILDQLTHRS
jgi:uncharacterized membrane-anchored protein YhcB (DUF1043 family)